MRFHYAEGMTRIENYIPLAQAAESCGYTGFTIPDSLIYPRASSTEYTYTDDGGREFLENKPFIESFVLATALGVITRTLEMTTNVVKLPVRPPLYSAKLAFSIAALTGDRFNLGVGLSVWPEDYAAMGVDFAKRGKRFDECIAIIRGLGSGEYFEFRGEFYDLPPVKLNPVPGKSLPILIGGHSDAALKRAARNDGFLCAGGINEYLPGMIAKINAYREEAGAKDRPFRIFLTEMGKVDLDYVKRIEEIGVTDLAVVFRNLYAVEEDAQPLSRKVDDLSRFADQVIARL